MDKTIQYNNRAVFYRITGSGIPVMLLHGFAEDGEIWKQQADYLQNDCQLIIPDLPGSGRSDRDDVVSMEAMAEAVKAVIEEEKIDELILIGHSMGGYITLALAEKYPALLKGFGLFHSTAYADSDERKAARKKNMAFIHEHGSHEFLQQSIPGLFGNDFKTQYPEVIQQIIEQYKNFDPLSLAAYQEAMMLRADKTEVLKRFSKPILFVIGKHDTAIPFNDSLQLSHLPALSFIHILEESGHMGMIEDPAKSNGVLKEFIEKV